MEDFVNPPKVECYFTDFYVFYTDILMLKDTDIAFM